MEIQINEKENRALRVLLTEAQFNKKILSNCGLNNVECLELQKRIGDAQTEYYKLNEKASVGITSP